jgi:alpha-L-fucosidase
MKNLASIICLLISISPVLLGQNKTVVDPVLNTSKEVLDDFMDKRFGMFIHWGPVSLRGTEIGWSLQGIQSNVI